MSQGASPAYRLVVSEQIQQILNDWDDQATEAGLGDEFQHSMRTILRELRTRPLEWGDPLFRLHAMNLLVCHGLTRMVDVYYGVDEVRRLVYLKEVRLMPHVNFDEDSPGL